MEIEQSIETFTYANEEASKYKIAKTIFLKIDEFIYVFSVDEFKELYDTTFLPTQALWNNK